MVSLTKFSQSHLYQPSRRVQKKSDDLDKNANLTKMAKLTKFRLGRNFLESAKLIKKLLKLIFCGYF